MTITNSKGLDPNTYKSQPFLWPLLKIYLPQKLPLNILDIGCGYGYHSHLMSELGHKVYGTDVSEEAIKNAKKNIPQARFICADIQNLPWDQLEGKFDVSIAMEVIEHLYFPRSLIRAAMRSLQPGGAFILSTPYHGYIKNLLISVLNKWDTHFNVVADGWHIKFFSPHTLRRLLKEEGFVDIEFRYGGRLPFIWKSMVCRARKPSHRIDVMTSNNE